MENILETIQFQNDNDIRLFNDECMLYSLLNEFDEGTRDDTNSEKVWQVADLEKVRRLVGKTSTDIENDDNTDKGNRDSSDVDAVLAKFSTTSLKKLSEKRRPIKGNLSVDVSHSMQVPNLSKGSFLNTTQDDGTLIVPRGEVAKSRNCTERSSETLPEDFLDREERSHEEVKEETLSIRLDKDVIKEEDQFGSVLEKVLNLHEASSFGKYNFKDVNFFDEIFLKEECSDDHVREENRFIKSFPLIDSYPELAIQDRSKTLLFYWFEVDELPTLLNLLKDRSDFIILQVLCNLKELTKSRPKSFTTVPNLLNVLGELYSKTTTFVVKRLTLALMAVLMKQKVLKDYLIDNGGEFILQKFMNIINRKEEIDHPAIRGQIVTVLAHGTSNDLNFTGFLIHCCKVNTLLGQLRASDDEVFKKNILTLMKHILVHPLGFEALTSSDFTFELLLRGALSLVPHYYNTSLNILNRLLVVSRSPHQDRIHKRFIKDKGIPVLVTLLEETHHVDPRIAMEAMALMDHLADGEKGVHAIICTAYNFLKSIVFYRGENMTKAKTAHTQFKQIPPACEALIAESKQWDTYNVADSAVYGSFDSSHDLVSEDAISSVKRGSSLPKVNKNKPEKGNRITEVPGAIRDCDRRLLVRSYQPSLWYKKHSEAFTCRYKYLNPEDDTVQKKIDDSLKLMAMEVIAKLATRKEGSMIVVDFIRNLCPILMRHSDNAGIAESVCYSLQMVCQSNFQQMKGILESYHIIRELMTALDDVYELRVKAAIIGVLAQLLKQSCQMVYMFSFYGIRLPLYVWLKKTSLEAPAFARLYCLIIIQKLSRYYGTRDLIASKTLVTNLFRTIQDGNSEDVIKIFAICSLASQTFANKRYRKIETSKKSEVLKSFYLKSSTFWNKEDTTKGKMEPEQIGFVEFDESGPYPTVNSFSSLDLDQEFLNLLDSQAPLDFFVYFLLKVMILRSPGFWSPLFIKFHDNIFNKLTGKRSMAEDLYHTIMCKIPTLSFYHQNIVYPWSQIDAEDFYICVEDDRYGTFPNVVSDSDHECDPIYCVYKLSKTEETPWTPWDIYWKERYNIFRYDIRLPMFPLSVFVDSIFGLGGQCCRSSEDQEVILVYQTKMKDILPQLPEKHFYFYPNVKQNTRLKHKLSTFSMSSHLSVCKKDQMKTNICPKQIILPTLYKYIRYLTHNTQLCGMSAPDEYVEDVSQFGKSDFTKLDFLSSQELEKPPSSKLTRFQLEQLTKSLVSPPSAWVVSFLDKDENQRTPEQDKMFREFEKSLSYYPNCFFYDTEVPLFHMNRLINASLPVPPQQISSYEKATNFVLTLILKVLENSGGKKLSLIRPGGNVENIEQMVIQRSDVKTMALSDEQWVRYLSSFGKHLINMVDTSSDDLIAQHLLGFPMRKTTYRESSAVSPPLKLLRGKSYNVLKRDGSCVQFESNIVEKTNNNSGKEKTVASQQTTGLTKNTVEKDGSSDRNLDNSDLVKKYFLQNTKGCQPMFGEVLIDLFFQSNNPKLRKPNYYPVIEMRCPEGAIVHSPLYKRLYTIIKETISESSDKDLSTDRNLALKIHRLVDRVSYTEKVNIQYLKDQKISIDKSLSPEDMEGFLKYFEVIHPVRNPDFREFCDYVLSGVQGILEKTYDIQCWYSDILKFIAKTVCRRLEGPFGFVDDFIMSFHRQELKRLLGTSVIPFGSLRIGGELERAILFKFFADRFAIPCGLYRQNHSNAWVEVPSHPFLFPKRSETYIVNLNSLPGELIVEGSLEADDYKNQTTKNETNVFESVFSDFRTDVGKVNDFFDSEGFLSYIKNKTNHKNFNKVKSEDIFYYFLHESLQNMNDIYTEGDGEAQEDDKYANCPYRISKDHFYSDVGKRNPFLENEESQQVLPFSKIDSYIDGNEQTPISELSQLKNLIGVSWKPDPDGKYTTIIGSISDSCFSFYTGPEGPNKWTAKHTSCDVHKDKTSDKPERIGDSFFSNNTLLLPKEANMFGNLEWKFGSQHIQYPENGDWETEDYFEKWGKILSKDSND